MVKFIEVDFPEGIYGATIQQANGYTIALCSGLSATMRAETIAHELEHIRQGDFQRGDPVTMIEQERTA